MTKTDWIHPEYETTAHRPLSGALNIVRQRYTALALLTMVGFLLRSWGMGWGLPLVFNPDEIFILDPISGFLRGDFNPHWFQYPSLFMYIVYVPIKIVSFGGALESSSMYMIGRCCAALMGALLIPLTYYLGARLFSAGVGWISALIVCFQTIIVEYSHYATPDVPLCFFVLLSICLSVYACQNKSNGMLVLAALAAGFASSVKYTGVFCLIPVMMCAWTQSRGRLLTKTIPFFLVVAACFGIAFILGTPYSVLDPATFMKGLYDQAEHSRIGHLGYEGSSFLYLLINDRNALRADTDPVTFLVFLLGILYGMYYSVRYKSLTHGVIILFVLASYAFLSAWQAKFVRWIIPLVPIAVVFGSGLLWLAISKIRLAGLRIFAVLILVIIPVLSSVLKARQFSLPDTRTAATDWAVKNIPRNARLFMNSYAAYVDSRLWYTKNLESTTDGYFNLVETPKSLNEFDYALISSYYRERYSFPQTLQLRPDLVRYAQAFYNSIETQGTLIAKFSPTSNCVGPEIEIYRMSR